MMYENDKLNIPEQYKKMSVSELRYEREKVYAQIKKNQNVTVKKTQVKKETVLFRF